MKILVIPDTQVKPGQDFSYLNAIGNYIVEKKPDVVVQIGDFCDMESLSSYDVGTKDFEGRRYKEDIKASRKAMEALMTPLYIHNEKAKASKSKQYHPELHLTLGNHEQRILKAVNKDAKLDGVLSVSDLGYEEYGWKVYPFLEVKVIEGIAFSHYFASGVKGLPVGNAKLLLQKMHMSCFAGHQQGRDIAYGKRADGKEMTAIICGSCYEHDEKYMGPQQNNHWRGIYVLHDVQDGAYDEMAVSLRYLRKKYG